MSDSVRPHRQQPTRLRHPWDSPGKNTGVGCHFLLQCMKVKSESEVAQSGRTLATPWTAAHQAPLSMGFSRQEYWSGVPLPSLVYNITHKQNRTVCSHTRHSPICVHTHTHTHTHTYASWCHSGKELTCQCRWLRDSDHWVGKILWGKSQQLTSLFSPGESHRQKRLVGYSPQGYKELDTTEAS